MLGSGLMLAAAQRSSLLDGLVGYWKLDGNGNDALGIGHASQDSGGSSWVAAKVGQGLFAPTVLDNLIVPDANAIERPTAAFSWAAWVKFERQPVSGQPQWSVDAGAASHRWRLYAITTSVLGVLVTTTGGTSLGRFSLSGTVFDPGVWHHYAWTWVAGSGIVTYRDGAPTGVAPITAPAGTMLAHATATGVYLVRGGLIASGDGATLDEQGHWNRVLTPDEVAALYNAGAGKTHPF